MTKDDSRMVNFFASPGSTCLSVEKLPLSDLHHRNRKDSEQELRAWNKGLSWTCLGLPLHKACWCLQGTGHRKSGWTNGEWCLVHWYKSVKGLPNINSPILVTESPFLWETTYPLSVPLVSLGLKPHQALEVSLWFSSGHSLPASLHLGSLAGAVNKGNFLPLKLQRCMAGDCHMDLGYQWKQCNTKWVQRIKQKNLQ